MKFLNLKDLTIDEIEMLDTKFNRAAINIENEKLFDLKSLFDKAAQKMLLNVKTTDANIFEFVINKEDAAAEDFITYANLILSSFFNEILKKYGRAREYRLDVPENIKRQVNCNMTLVKRAINHATYVDKFNVWIKCRDFRFELVGDLYE